MGLFTYDSDYSAGYDLKTLGVLHMNWLRDVWNQKFENGSASTL